MHVAAPDTKSVWRTASKRQQKHHLTGQIYCAEWKDRLSKMANNQDVKSDYLGTAVRWEAIFLQITSLIPVLKNTLWVDHVVAQSSPLTGVTLPTWFEASPWDNMTNHSLILCLKGQLFHTGFLVSSSYPILYLGVKVVKWGNCHCFF